MTNHKEAEVGWNFDNSYMKLPDHFYTVRQPIPVDSPRLVIFNKMLADELGLNSEVLKEVGVSVFAGNSFPDGAAHLAQAYAGHQFGGFTILGDGRAILVGEQITPTNKRFDIQLKGSGRTAYSRGGDGRSTLGPMLREYIISEAMYALGIPTTRSLAVVTTGEMVMRERELPGAILTRVASSHLRVGTFEYAAKSGSIDNLKALADYTIKRHFPNAEYNENPYMTLFVEVMKRQAKLIANWQLVGFVHGVMNTDNMSLAGETIDYGPCAFIDTYNPKTVFSSIDEQGRYAYGNQPGIGGWNLARFAETLLPLLDDDMEKAVALAQESLDKYGDLFHTYWIAGMRAKLGLYNEEKEDKQLIDDLLRFMEEYEADYTNTFKSLTLGQLEADVFKEGAFKAWYTRWQSRLKRQSESAAASTELMKKSNPAVIPRNYLVEEALEEAVENNDYSVIEKLLEVLLKPYAYTQNQEKYAKTPPKTSFPYQTFCGT